MKQRTFEWLMLMSLVVGILGTMAGFVGLFSLVGCPSSCPTPINPPPPSTSDGGDGWCAASSSSSCPSSAPHAFILCGTGEGAAPYPYTCSPGVIVTNPNGAVCCP